jgi:haloalkane dehalogenase
MMLSSFFMTGDPRSVRLGESASQLRPRTRLYGSDRHAFWSDLPERARATFRAFRSPAGEDMVLRDNAFVERVLPGSMMRQLSRAEMEHYRRPFLNPGEDRRPTLTWPRQIPLDGEPADVVQIVSEYSQWLARSKLPKLYLHSEPGALDHGRQREFCRTWPNQTEVTVKGVHFIQEDSPTEIGAAVANFVRALQPPVAGQVDS